MLGVNVLANTLPLNGVTTAQVSQRFNVFFVPAGYVFAIWGPIYLLLIAFVMYVFLPQSSGDKTINKALPYYYLSGFANAAWLFAWHYGVFWLTGLLMLVLLGSLIQIYRIIHAEEPENNLEKWLKFLPFSVYLAWISIATIANFADVLQFYGWNGFGIPGQTWTAALIIATGLLSLVFIFSQRDRVFPLVIIWALVGILVNFGSELPIMASVEATVVLILVGLCESYNSRIPRHHIRSNIPTSMADLARKA